MGIKCGHTSMGLRCLCRVLSGSSRHLCFWCSLHWYHSFCGPHDSTEAIKSLTKVCIHFICKCLCPSSGWRCSFLCVCVHVCVVVLVGRAALVLANVSATTVWGGNIEIPIPLEMAEVARTEFANSACAEWKWQFPSRCLKWPNLSKELGRAGPLPIPCKMKWKFSRWWLQ